LLNSLAMMVWLAWPGAHVLTAETAEEVSSRFTEHEPDVVLIELASPQYAAYDVLRWVRGRSEVPIILLSHCDSEIDEVRALAFGADGYLKYPFGELLLLARMRAVLRRTEAPPCRLRRADVQLGDLAINYTSGRVTLRGDPVHLTSYEYRLLTYLVRHADRLVSYRELEDHLWGAGHHATPENLAVFVRRLRLKLEPNPSHPRFILNERGMGYRFSMPKQQLAA